MADKNVTLICAAADQAAARVIANDSGMFGVPLSTSEGVTNAALATHFASSGFVASDIADALDVSLAPMFKVFDLKDGQTFDTHLGMCTPPLYRVIEGL